MSKTDPVLGESVHRHLLSVGLETPVIEEKLAVKDEKKIKIIQKNVTTILETLGMDLSDDSLCDTPIRVARMFVNDLYWGLQYDKFPKCTAIDNKMNYGNSFILEKNITLHSTCEHHLVTIDGLATVAYRPQSKVIGLSKMNRIVQFFAKRPQVQERLSEQIAEAISFIAQTPDVAVHIEAKHYCVASRGIQDVNSSTITLSTRGIFSDIGSAIRNEFISTLK